VIIPVVIIILILIIYSIFTVFISAPSRPQLSIYSDNWADLSVCRKDIKDQGYKVSSIISSPTILSKLDEKDYKNTVYIAIGIERPYTEDEADMLWTFMNKGGNIIIADDFGHGNSFWVEATNYDFDDINMRFGDKQLYDPNYIKNTKFVKVNATILSSPNIYNLILNEPAALDMPLTYNPRYYNIITSASSSDEAWLDENNNGVRDPRELKGAYHVIARFTGEEYKGRAVVISDPGLFINDNWGRLNNSRFVLDLLYVLIPDGGEVIFDESRHINQEPLENSRRIMYSGLVFFTSTIWSVIVMAIVVISFTIFIGVKLKPQNVWRNSNLLNKKYFNILNYPYLGSQDFWQIYNTFLEKVRLGYGFSPDEFKEQKKKTLHNLINDDYLWQFISQQFYKFVDVKYYNFIVDRILHWNPKTPEISEQHYGPGDHDNGDYDAEEYYDLEPEYESEADEYEEVFIADDDQEDYDYYDHDDGINGGTDRVD